LKRFFINNENISKGRCEDYKLARQDVHKKSIYSIILLEDEDDKGRGPTTISSSIVIQ